jgi:hypothetical protein
MDKFDYVTVMDSAVGNTCGGAGYLFVCGPKERPESCFTKAVEKAAAVSATRLRVIAHGSYEYGFPWVDGEYAGFRGGYGFDLGNTTCNVFSLERDWRPVRQHKFEGIVLLVCGAAAGKEVKYQQGNGFNYCQKIADYTNCPVFASDSYQPYVRSIAGSGIKMLPWVGNVYMFKPNQPALRVQGPAYQNIPWYGD